MWADEAANQLCIVYNGHPAAVPNKGAALKIRFKQSHHHQEEERKMHPCSSLRKALCLALPLALALTLALLPASAVSPETHRFTPKVGYPTFAKREPVLRLKPGDIVETSSLWGEWYERAGGAWPGE